MLANPVCNEDDIVALVHNFYRKVLADPALGPVFNAAIPAEDWPAHLNKMVDFWSSLLRGTARYSGTPMPKHIALPNLEPALFKRWLELFAETTAELDNPPMQQRANTMAQRIARSLWMGYQMHNHPDRIPADLTAA